MATALAAAATLLATSCRAERAAPNLAVVPTPRPPAETPPREPRAVPSAAVPPASAGSLAPRADPATAPLSFADWLRARLPPGGQVVEREGGTLAVIHRLGERDSPDRVAAAYLDLTTIYRAKDLAAELTRRERHWAPGGSIEIPSLLSAPYGSPDEERLPWPPDKALKGVFITGVFAGLFWPETIEKLAARRLNAVVLDGKDYMGPITYPTHVALAIEAGAAKSPPIPDLFRAIRFAHARGVHVIVRIPCFHDPWMAEHAPRLSLMGRNGRPFSMGWLDPVNPEAQAYLVDIVSEVVRLGADEVQLDYVRFPVQSLGIKNAAMPPPDGQRSAAMQEFVRRVHSVTQAGHAALSLDLFGVTATGTTSDIEALGQNIGTLGGDAEALSPMVYPSHYTQGWNGFDEPGNHPEIIGIGTRAALQKLRDANVAGTILRPWLQGSSYKASRYGPQYVLEEIRSAEASGAVGWLFWDPQNSYWAVWQAIPPATP